PAGGLGRQPVGSRARRGARAGGRGERARADLPSDVVEDPGQGIAGTVEGHRVAVGSRSFLRASGYSQDEVAAAGLLGGRGSGEARVMVGVDGRVAGVIVMADELRPDAASIVERLRSEGVRHIAMVSGD